MPLTHYIDYKVNDIMNEPSLVGRILNNVHGFISQNNLNTIAIDLPNKDNKDILCFGAVFRVFAKDEVSLNSFMDSEGMINLVRSGSLSTIGVMPIPDTDKYEVLSRERSTEKLTYGYLVRSEKRFIKRRQAEGVSEEDLEAMVAERRKVMVNNIERNGYSKTVCFIKTKSCSTGQSHSISLLSSKKINAVNGVFSSYGLSFDGSTIPVF